MLCSILFCCVVGVFWGMVWRWDGVFVFYPWVDSNSNDLVRTVTWSLWGGLSIGRVRRWNYSTRELNRR